MFHNRLAEYRWLTGLISIVYIEIVNDSGLVALVEKLGRILTNAN